MSTTAIAAALGAAAGAAVTWYALTRTKPAGGAASGPQKAGATNVHWHAGAVTREARWGKLGQKGAIVWLTGLSGSGKSTIAYAVERDLLDRGVVAYILDGDNLRHTLNSDLGFSPEDRAENVRRVAHLASILADAGIVVLACFISPTVKMRTRVRELAASGRDPVHFAECFVDAPLAVAEGRDPKGLYKKARKGEIKHFTGIDSPFEAPPKPELHLETASMSLQQEVDAVINYLRSQHIVKAA